MTRLSRSQLAGALLAVAVAAAVAIGIWMLGSPAEARAYRLDDRRVRDLSVIARSVNLYWTRHGRLPADLTDLRREPGLQQISSSDPATSVSYEYRPLDDRRFEICARFERDSREPDPLPVWTHGSGRQCFERRARKME